MTYRLDVEGSEDGSALHQYLKENVASLFDEDDWASLFEAEMDRKNVSAQDKMDSGLSVFVVADSQVIEDCGFDLDDSEKSYLNQHAQSLLLHATSHTFDQVIGLRIKFNIKPFKEVYSLALNCRFDIVDGEFALTVQRIVAEGVSAQSVNVAMKQLRTRLGGLSESMNDLFKNVL